MKNIQGYIVRSSYRDNMARLILHRTFMSIFSVIICVSFCRDQYFVQNVDFLDQTVQYTPYLWHRNSISRLQCCALCNLDSSCRSAIFDNGECYGTDLLTISSAHSQEQSIQVFTKQDDQRCRGIGYLWYKNLCLRLYTTEQTWSEASMSCTSHNGHLIVLHTEEKQATLQEFVDIYYDFLSQHPIYVGVGVQMTIYDPYEDGQTSNDSCEAFDVGLGQLSNVPCDVKRPFVCERDIFSFGFLVNN